MSDLNPDIPETFKIDGFVGLDGLDYMDDSIDLYSKANPVRVLTGWPLAVSIASLCASTAVVAWQRGRQSQRVWVDAWTGGPEDE